MIFVKTAILCSSRWAQTLRSAGFFESSNNFYTRASRHNAAKKDAAARESILLDIGLNWLELQDGKQARAALERAVKDYPKSSRRAEMLQALERANALAKNN